LVLNFQNREHFFTRLNKRLTIDTVPFVAAPNETAIITNKDFRFPVYMRLSADTLQAYKLGGTPQTLVISGEGRVQKNWMGAYNGATKTDIETFFRIKLPDVPRS
jgi:hypothetical protein